MFCNWQIHLTFQFSNPNNSGSVQLLPKIIDYRCILILNTLYVCANTKWREIKNITNIFFFNVWVCANFIQCDILKTSCLKDFSIMIGPTKKLVVVKILIKHLSNLKIGYTIQFNKLFAFFLNVIFPMKCDCLKSINSYPIVYEAASQVRYWRGKHVGAVLIKTLFYRTLRFVQHTLRCFALRVAACGNVKFERHTKNLNHFLLRSNILDNRR